MTTTYTLTATNTAGSATSTAKVTVTASGGPLAITTTSCPGGTQGAAYAGCTIVAAGGTPPYTFSVSRIPTFLPCPRECLSMRNGCYQQFADRRTRHLTPEIVVTDSTTRRRPHISFAINGNNAFLANIFPSTSIFHHRVDAATTSLPVDTSPAAPMYSGYLSATVKPFFGNNRMRPFPMEYPPSKFPTTRRTSRSPPPSINRISPRVRFPLMLRWRAPATRRETGTFWFTSKQAVETTRPFTKCGKESTKTVPGPIPRMRFGPTFLRTP